DPRTPTAEQMTLQAARRAASVGDQNFRTNLHFLRSLVGSIQSLPGQRVIILLSSGFLTPNDEAAKLISAVIDAAAEQDVTISTIDSRGLYTTNWDPTERSSRSTQAAEAQDQYRKASMASSENVLASLAAGTGGSYVHNTNDLKAGFEGLFAGPEILYLLAFD